MPTIAENKREWDGAYSWTQQGDEWSRPWGSVEMQWYASLLPRIQSHLPAQTILEIACGFGRWTQYLTQHCDHLIAVDLSQECVDACRQRFGPRPGIEYHVNDGKSLEMVPSNSVDFIFSYDSLVHADASVLEAYLSQFSRILTANGVAFIHHSNLGAYRTRYARVRRVPKLEGLLITLGALDEFVHWRDPGVSAALVARLADENGLRCITQEVVHWRTKRAMIDCMSTITKRGSTIERANQLWMNDKFMSEAAYAASLTAHYPSAAPR